jgi:hypothetical protein
LDALLGESMEGDEEEQRNGDGVQNEDETQNQSGRS